MRRLTLATIILLLLLIAGAAVLQVFVVPRRMPPRTPTPASSATLR